MDLFVVNRYNGEDDKLANVKEEQEKTILAKLQNKIKKRRSAKLLNNQQQNGINIQNKIAEADNPESISVGHADFSNLEQNQNNTSQVNATDPNSEDLADNTTESNSKKSRKRKKKQTEAPEGYTILGVDTFKPKPVVKRVLPYWLQNPSIISVNLQSLNVSVEELPDLSDTLKANMKDNGFSHLFPVQIELVPWLIRAQNRPEPFRPRDVCVSAPTGSGKTLAFVLPIVQSLTPRVVRKIRALVVLPVQELAVQVASVFRKMCIGSDLKVILLSGSTSIANEEKMLVTKSHTGNYMSRVDIVVSTAGRLVEHLHNTPGFTLESLKYLVLDEADRIMEQAQNDWLYHLERHMKTETFLEGRAQLLTVRSLYNEKQPPQKLLFSATLSQDPEKLERLGLFEPKLFTSIVAGSEVESTDKSDNKGEFIGKYTTPAELQEYYILCESEYKPLSLYQLIIQEKWTNIICFTNSSESVHRLSILLQHMCKGLKVAELSAKLTRKAREDVFKKFTDGEVNILVSSDALARGIDIPNVQVVVSYDSPKFVKNYIHRVGRTGRAGKKGTAVTLVLNKHLSNFQNMLKEGGKEISELKLNVVDQEKDAELYKSSLSELKTSVQTEEDKTMAKIKVAKSGKSKRKYFEGKGRKNNKKFKEA